MGGRLKVGLLLLGIFALGVWPGAAPAQQYDLRATYPAGSPGFASKDVQAAVGPTSPETPVYAFTEEPSDSSATVDGGPLRVERLPPVDGSGPSLAEPAAKFTQEFPGGLLLPGDDVVRQEESRTKSLPPGMRRAGLFQGITLGGSWLATGSGRGGLGISASSVETQLVLPSLIPDSYLTITPGYGISRFDNPGPHDIPDEVHDAAVGFGLRGRYSALLSYQAEVSVGAYGDFEDGSSELVRVRGYGSAMYQWNPTVDVMFGVAYVDLEDWPVLPIGGLVFRPDEDQVLSVTFPRMSYSRRLAIDGTFGRPVEYWGNVGVELTGGRWIVRRRDDTLGDLTYRDWRVTLGIQRKAIELYDLKFDVGYVFGRRIEYEDDYDSFAPDDTVSLTLTGRF